MGNRPENLPGRAHGLSADQGLAVEQIATSGRILDVPVRPTGTGKSTTMGGLRAVWERQFGPGTVVGLAPSAAARDRTAAYHDARALALEFACGEPLTRFNEASLANSPSAVAQPF